MTIEEKLKQFIKINREGARRHAADAQIKKEAVESTLDGIQVILDLQEIEESKKVR